jgi:hypothetical protein
VLGVWGFFEATHDPLVGVVFLLGLFSLGLGWALLFGVGFACCALMESLILAQDERWRRA